MKQIACALLLIFLGSSFLPADPDIDFQKARQLFEKQKSGETLTNEEREYLERAKAARAQLVRIQPLDATGNPSPEGKIVLASISMSNATQEFSFFKRVADSAPQKSPKLTIVDCAQGGQAMAEWAPPDAASWTE